MDPLTVTGSSEPISSLTPTLCDFSDGACLALTSRHSTRSSPPEARPSAAPRPPAEALRNAHRRWATASAASAAATAIGEHKRPELRHGWPYSHPGVTTRRLTIILTTVTPSARSPSPRRPTPSSSYMVASSTPSPALQREWRAPVFAPCPCHHSLRSALPIPFSRAPSVLD